MNAKNEIQAVIDDYCAGIEDGVKPTVKKTIVINRKLTSLQQWKFEVLMPEESELQVECLQQVDCEGIDYGAPQGEHCWDTDEEVIFAEDLSGGAVIDDWLMD